MNVRRMGWVACLLSLVPACGSPPRVPVSPPEPLAPPPEPTQAELARSAMDWSEAWREALPKLTDQKLLADVAIQAESTDARRLAAERVEEPAQLARMALSRDPVAAPSAIERLDDQAVLARLARGHDAWLAAKAARRVTDQRVLAELAGSYRPFEVREVAVERLTDQDLLLRVALAGAYSNDTIEARAARKLTDPAALARVVAEAEPSLVRAAAAGGVEDQELLGRLASDRDDRVRLVAIRRLTDTHTLRRIATEAESLPEAYAAMARLTDEEVLSEVLLETHSPRRLPNPPAVENRDSRFDIGLLRLLLLADCLPPVELEVVFFRQSTPYGYSADLPITAARMEGEQIDLRVLDEAGNLLHSRRYRTRFPERTEFRAGERNFRRAEFDQLQFVTGLLGAWPELDLPAIARGPAPIDLRRAAIAHLDDVALLTELASEEAECGEPLGAAERLAMLGR